MKTSKLLIFPFLGILFFLASCTDDPTKQEVFEDFVKEQLPGKGKDKKVQYFILKHYNFLNEEELFNGDEYDTNHVCLFLKNGEDFKYSFRLVADREREGIDDYEDGFTVYNTSGDLSEDELKPFQNNFRKLAYFLYDMNGKLSVNSDELAIDDLNAYIVDLEERLVLANANLKHLGFKEVNIQSILKRINLSKDKQQICCKIKEGKNELILNVKGYALNWSDVDIEAQLSLGYSFHLKKLNTAFIENCDGVESDNCGLPHVTNLFINYKGVYYGIDKWNEIF